jgi:hypothetical protein
LITAGLVDPDYEDAYGNTLLNKAVPTQDGKLIEEILDLGVDPDYANKFGMTALMLACKGGYSKSVSAILWDPIQFGNVPKLQCYPLRANRFGMFLSNYHLIPHFPPLLTLHSKQ